MSKLQVNDIVNKDDDGSVGFPKGVVVTGVATATSFSGAVNAGIVTATTIQASSYVGVPVGFTELDAALFN